MQKNIFRIGYKSMKIAVRIDDITPDMDWDSFYSFKELLDQYGIKPLIGIVPDNKDANLSRGKVREDFWIYMKELQNAGWSLALHGMHHVYTTKKGGIFPLNHFSEFAGVPYQKQENMLTEGTRILKEHGISTDIFMAPGHSYDQNTLLILEKLGYRYMTDGFSSRPYIERKSGLVFLPIAVHSKKDIEKPEGYTTLVFHLNGTNREQLKKIARIFETHKDDFISYEEYKKTAPFPQLFFGKMRERLLAEMKHFLMDMRGIIKRR